MEFLSLKDIPSTKKVLAIPFVRLIRDGGYGLGAAAAVVVETG